MYASQPWLYKALSAFSIILSRTANLSPMTARNHHFIPQCYLKGFARNLSKNSKLLAIDFESKTAFGTSPKSVAVQRDFNRVDLGGLSIDALEQDYAKLEGHVATALRAIEETRRFDAIDHLSSIINLIAILAVRTPKGREFRRRIAERVVKDSFLKNTASREAYDAHEELTREQRQAANISDFPYEIIKAYVDNDQYSVELSTMHHIEQELPMFREIFPYLRDRRWRLWIAPEESGGFVTSDHPVGIVWQESHADGTMPGFASPNSSVSFPLSQNMAISGHFDIQGGTYIASREHVAAINTITICFADRQVYSEDERFEYMWDGGIKRNSGAGLLNDLLAVRKGDVR